MSIPGFAEWLETPLGQYLITWERKEVEALIADSFGFHALQVGRPEIDFLRDNRIRHRVLCGEAGAGQLVCEPCALPIGNQSVDLVVLPHVLEFSDHPHQVLREVERVLVPGGQVVLAVFNPISLWGVRRMIAGDNADFPWQGQFLSVRRIRDWLQLLGFETQAGSFGAYIPPVTSEKWIDRWRFVDEAADRWWPIAGGAYLIKAIKRVPGMRLLAPAWQKNGIRAKRLAPVAQSGIPQKTNRTKQ